MTIQSPIKHRSKIRKCTVTAFHKFLNLKSDANQEPHVTKELDEVDHRNVRDLICADCKRIIAIIKVDKLMKFVLSTILLL